MQRLSLMVRVALVWAKICQAQAQQNSTQDRGSNQNNTQDGGSYQNNTQVSVDNNANSTNSGNTTQRRKPTGFILGGTAVDSQQYPFYVRLFGKNNFCGATLIAMNIVMTGAHCLDNSRDPRDYRVEFLQGGVQSSVYRLKVHEYYNVQQTGFQHDLAVLYLSSDAPQGAQPVSIDFNPVASGQEVTLIGMGQSQPNEKISKNLNHVQSVILEPKFCQNGLDYSFDTNTMLCVSGYFGKTAAPGKLDHPSNDSMCFITKLDTLGDSGGPMVGPSGVLGTTGFGRKASVGNAAVTYTKLSNYKEWLEQSMYHPPPSPENVPGGGNPNYPNNPSNPRSRSVFPAIFPRRRMLGAIFGNAILGGDHGWMTPEDLQGWAVMPGGWQGWGYAGLM
jgi:secreted trypsin-like serine protease